MPELPEVETVRVGLRDWVQGRRISDVEVLHPRAVRRHVAGALDFADGLRGRRITGVHRRGKYLWLSLGDGLCLLAHLGMSGQLLVQRADVAPSTHLRVAFRFDDGGPELRFVDQRTFGGLVVDELIPDETVADELVPDQPVPTGDAGIPSLISHIARDPLDPTFDPVAWRRAARRRSSAVKRLLLDQSLISGVGNIYADEALWRARLHGLRPAPSVAPSAWTELLDQVREVMSEAIAAGGTSFDALYVNVNGRSGYFDRSLAVYGQEGRPCPRCATPIRRTPFMNRSSFWCPTCQRPPRTRPVV